jgi:hypothetical protein
VGEELKLEYAIAVGDGSFPFDMLRHDECFPACCDHCSWLLDGDENEEKRVVILGRYMQQSSRWSPDLWAHYGWTLTLDDLRGFECLGNARHAVQILVKENKGLIKEAY